MKLGQFLSPFLKVEDLQGPITVTIRRFVVEEIKKQGGEPKKKDVLIFKEFDKGLVLGKTLINQLASIFKSLESNDMIGKQVELYIDENVTFGGEVTGGIRIRKVNGNG